MSQWPAQSMNCNGVYSSESLGLTSAKFNDWPSMKNIAERDALLATLGLATSTMAPIALSPSKKRKAVMLETVRAVATRKSARLSRAASDSLTSRKAVTQPVVEAQIADMDSSDEEDEVGDAYMRRVANAAIVFAKPEFGIICERLEDGSMIDNRVKLFTPADSEPSSAEASGGSVPSTPQGNSTRKSSKSGSLDRDLFEAKKFGHPKGVSVGSWFKDRETLHKKRVHRGFVQGIFGDSGLGAYCVVISGGYEDDVDEGSSIIFTGEGGRNLTGSAKKRLNLRTGQ